MLVILKFVALLGIPIAFSSNEIQNPVENFPQWHKTIREDKRATTYVHGSSLGKKAELSYFSLYPVSTKSGGVEKMMADLRADKAKTQDESLLPAQCYRLSRKDLSSRQTWCEKNSDVVLAVVEEGPVQMKENKKTEIILQAVLDAKDGQEK